MIWLLLFACADADKEAAREIAAQTSGPADLHLAVGPSEQAFQGVEVVCPSGYRWHEPLRDARLTFTLVPAEPCQVRFKGGGPPVPYEPVRGGEVLACTFDLGEADCRPTVLEEPGEASPLLVAVDGEAPFATVAIECPGGYQEERTIAAENRFQAVPGEDCMLWFRGGGGPPAHHHPVRGGQTLSCAFERRRPDCTER